MLARLLGQSRRTDVEAEVVTLMPPGFVGRKMTASGISVHSLGMTNMWTAMGAAMRLARHIRAAKPDLVMAWMHHAQLATTLAVPLSGVRVPVVWNVRHSLGSGYAHEKRTTRLILRIQSALSHKPAAIIYNSRAAAHQYRAIGFEPRCEHVIPNGFEVDLAQSAGDEGSRLRRIFGIAEGQVVIGMVARAHPMKDVANLVAAFALLRSSRFAAHLLIVGEGMDKPSPDVAAALARLPEGSWTLSGQRGDVPEWLGGLDILALPSAWGEGFPNIVGEAMAKGVPCVGTDVGDTAWVIGPTGRSVPPQNATALAQALMEFCGMTGAERKALGNAARQRIRDMFTLDQVIARYDALYDEMTGSMAPATPLPVRREAA